MSIDVGRQGCGGAEGTGAHSGRQPRGLDENEAHILEGVFGLPNASVGSGSHSL